MSGLNVRKLVFTHGDGLWAELGGFYVSWRGLLIGSY